MTLIVNLGKLWSSLVGDVQTVVPESTSPPAEPSGDWEIETATAERDLPIPALTESADEFGPEALFASIAASYCQPIKEFIAELRRGTATREWIEICLPLTGSVIHGAVSLDMHEAAEKMTAFRDELSEIGASDTPTLLEGSTRESILERYEALARAMPRTFESDSNADSNADSDGDSNGDSKGGRCENVIVHALLRQIPDVGRVTLDRLYSAGLGSLDTLYLATPEEVAATTGVALPLCEQICRHVTDYRVQIETMPANDAKGYSRQRLAALMIELQRCQRGLRRIASTANAPADDGTFKRDRLRRRQSCSLQIEVLLAEMGEVELIHELRTLAVGPRIRRLKQYLGLRSGDAQSAPAVSRTIPEE